MRTSVMLALCAVAGATIHRAPDGRERGLRLVDAAGAIAIGNQHEAEAILSSSGLVPGSNVRGRVTVAAGMAALVLSQSPPIDVAGPNGGLLSERLTLRVEDVSDPSAPRLVYSGGLGALSPTALGPARDGAGRTFEFTVAFPAGDDDVNAVMGSSTTVGFHWDAVAADGSFGSASSSRPGAAVGPACPPRRGTARARCRARAAFRAAKARCAKRPEGVRADCYARATTAHRRTLALIRCRTLTGSRRVRCRARARGIPSPPRAVAAFNPDT